MVEGGKASERASVEGRGVEEEKRKIKGRGG